VASLTVRNIPEDAKLRFRQIAAAHGRSMEEHLRQMILSAGVPENRPETGVTDVTQSFRHFETAAPAQPPENWVQELIRLGEGAGEGVFDREPQSLRDFDL
jgi:plasmid stability protein